MSVCVDCSNKCCICGVDKTSSTVTLCSGCRKGGQKCVVCGNTIRGTKKAAKACGKCYMKKKPNTCLKCGGRI